MNAPAQYERFVVPDNLDKATYTKDKKMQNAANVVLQREDHTVGNLLRCQLHKDSAVRFAGYKVPHPLDYELHLKVQTDGSCQPNQCFDKALKQLDDTLSQIDNEFSEALSNRNKKFF